MHWVITRVRYHLRWRHGYVAIPAWQPEGARRVTADEVAVRRRPAAGRKQPAVIDLAAQVPPPALAA
ncbi:hypothetical protein [Kineosporia sp. R_H_3]|uniref:hypothetical protein n=1 Tax=Kineosporia sp. R_H_3 TaxID=1961848 RepID=UPI000B4BE691|nr:hypothetical protein [Kineosporia sp. R_H_3]